MFDLVPSEVDMTHVKRLRGPFLVIAVVILASIGITYYMGRIVIRGHEEITRRHEDVARLREVQRTVVEAETGQRGYLLTENISYLAPYTAAKARITAELKALQGFEEVQIHELERQIDLKLEELAATLAAHDRNGGLPASLQIVNTNQGQLTMRSIRELTDAMAARAEADTATRLRQIDQLGMFRTLVFALCGLVCLTFVLWAYRRIRREAEHSTALTAMHLHQKRILSVALTSIGDAVIMTDQEGRITLMNKVAEELTGWSFAEASRQECSKVFHIINERSRLPVESPVTKVLRTGAIVGLANHTLLVRRDGTEISIDDSGAPIKDEHGNVYGVVLIFRDFSEHRRSEQILLRAMEEAEAANIAKDNFLATLSHELRTPLTPVVVTLSNLESDPELPAHLQDDIQLMRRNLELEARLIDDLLDLTRIVKGKLPLNLEVANVHELLSSVEEMYHSEIHARNLRVTLKLEAAEHYALVDSARLQQVFWNILKNATKFSPKGGRIDITSGIRDAHIEISFVDEGIGMSPEMLQRLFRPFEQGAEEAVRRYGGLGLGMAISKALIEAQQGTINAQSDGVNRGSKFVVTLPWAHPAETPMPVNAPVPRPSGKLNILLVEDHPDTANAMTRLLTGAGHQVKSASTVAGGKGAIEAGGFDMLLCDVGLPDGTGLDLIAVLRKKGSIPAIALTGFGMEADVKQCLQAGFNSHLTKPLNLQRLFEEIDRLTAASN